MFYYQNLKISLFCRILFLLWGILTMGKGGLSADTWPVFQHDLGHTSLSNEILELPLEPKWSTPLCEWFSGGVSPIVSNGSVAVAGSYRYWDTTFPQSVADLKFWAISLANGSIAWKKDMPGGVVSAAQISGDKVYVVSWDARVTESDPYHSTLWALNLSNGSVAWYKHFEGWWASAPAVSGNTLVIPVMYKPFLQTGNGILYAYNATTGTYLWQYNALNRYLCGIYYEDRPDPPCIAGGKVYFQDQDHLYAVNIVDGSKAWSLTSYGGLDFWELMRPIVVADGKVFFCEHNTDIPEDARVMCVNAENGAEIWQWPKLSGDQYASSNINAMTYAGGILYVSLYWTQMDDAVVLLNATSGAYIDDTGEIDRYTKGLVITGDGKFLNTGEDLRVVSPDFSQVLFDFTDDHGLTIYEGRTEPALDSSLVITSLILESLDDFSLTAMGHDTTPPVADITSPEGPLVNPGLIEVRGYALDFNFDFWELAYSSLEDPDSWTVVTSDTERNKWNDPFISFWDVKEIGDGNFRIRLRVFDKAGNVSIDDDLTISQDHTLPESTITYPTDALSLETLSLDVTGTASDNMGLGKVQVWDSVSGVWHDAEGTTDWTYHWSTTNSCQSVTFQSRAIDWAGNVETPKPGVTVTLSPKVRVVAVYPDSHATVSTVMQGGKLHRWVRVEDSLGNSVAKARVYFSTAAGSKYVTADTGGVADLNMDSLNLLSSSTRITDAVPVNVPITQVKYSTCVFTPLETLPTIPVSVEPRKGDHVWAAGLSQSLKAGITAYVQGEAGGGTEVAIANNKDLFITQNFNAGVGVGVEGGPDFDLGIAEAGASAEASIMLLLRGDQKFNMGDALCGDLENQDCRDRRKAYASLMIISMARTASVLSNPTVNAIIGVIAGVAYHGYLEEESIDAGVKISAGGSVSSSLGLSSDAGASADIGLSLIDASVDLAYLIGMNVYPKTGRIGIQATQEIETKLSVLTFSVAGQDQVSATDFFGLSGANLSFVFTEEMIFDTSGNPREFVLSISDGEEKVTYRVDEMDQIQTLLATGAANIAALGRSMTANPGGLQLGFQACSQELSHIIGTLMTVPVHYEKTAVYKIKDFDYTLSLDFNVQVITVGGALSVNYLEKRVYAAEVGVVESGVKHVLATYTYDTYVRGDTHTLGNLMSGILDGLWLYVADALGWVAGKAYAGYTWVVEKLPLGKEFPALSSAAVTPSEPWARLSGPAHSVSTTTDIAIISYPPENNPMHGLTVIGECNDFQPGNLVPLLALSLEIGYGDTPLPPGCEPSQLNHWNNTPGKWELVPGSVMDTGTHVATASIMEMGVYAIGADLTSPTIELLPPASDGFTTPGAVIKADVTDEISGVDQVSLYIDSQLKSSSYDEEKGLLQYLPQPPLTQGAHEIKITAVDKADNSGTRIWNVLVDNQPPVAQITLPLNGSELRKDIVVQGTAQDANLDYYLVQMIPQNGKALWWIGLPVRKNVVSGALAQFDSALIDDGPYTLILIVKDKAGNKTVSQINVSLSNHKHGILLR